MNTLLLSAGDANTPAIAAEIIKNGGDIAEQNDRKELINYIIKSLLQNNNQT